MKFVYSYNTHQNERREGLTISAPNRDAAFSELNRRGIRPYKLYPAPGLWNKVLALGWRGPLMAVLGAALAATAALALVQRRDMAEMEKTGEVRQFVADAIASRVRRQLIGDQGVIDRGIRNGWSGVFDGEGERFLASFALPGIPATVRTTNVVALEEALKRKVEVNDKDGIEAMQIKAMVEGMKDELRRFVAAGGTIEQYGRRLVARQEDEIAIYARACNEIEQTARSGVDKSEIVELLDRRNEELHRMGIKPVSMPDLPE